MENGWSPLINKELMAFGTLRWLVYEYESNKMCPKDKKDVFRAFKLTPYESVRVVILGQDPYHTPGIADGLAFSSANPSVTPPSLRNIFKAIELDLGIQNTHPNLEGWAKQGVLLMNTALTTIEGQAAAHTEDWKRFTLAAIRALDDHPNKIIFLLWGKAAQSFEGAIGPKHTILKASHPSPFSAKNFINCKHFSQVNEILVKNGQNPIVWSTDSESSKEKELR